jgi:hypothetical protein
MEKHLVHIPTPLLYAREARMWREKNLLKARQSPARSEHRKIDLELAMLAKKHELSWMETYRKECM